MPLDYPRLKRLRRSNFSFRAYTFQISRYAPENVRLSKIRRDLAKTRLILDKMYRLYGKFASYLRHVLCKTRLIFPRINGPFVALCDAM